MMMTTMMMMTMQKKGERKWRRNLYALASADAIVLLAYVCLCVHDDKRHAFDHKLLTKIERF
jgi:hypothetical protein